MSFLDYVIFFAYLVGVLALGVLLRRSRNRDDFFLAGRTMGWFPIGLSVMVTVFSAINYLAFPSEVIGHGLYVLAALPVFVIVAFPITRVFIPFFHEMQLTSAYEYLQRRFDGRVRRLASGLFVLWRMMWIATALYASARFMSAITGFELWALIVIAGAIASAYTAVGGMRAVMWTDVAQFAVLFGGIAVSVAFAIFQIDDGFTGVLRLTQKAGMLRPFAAFDPDFFSPDPTIRITIFSAMIGVTVAFLTRYGADQIVMQRYFTARSLKQAQSGFCFNVVAALISLSLLAVFGLAAAAYSLQGATSYLPPIKQIVLLIRALPAGLLGLIAAGLLAATMSSVDSGVNACAAALMTDFGIPGRSAKHDGAPRGFTFLLGVFATLLAIVMIPLFGPRQTIFVVVNKIIHGLGSPLLAIMVCGMFSRFANSSGVLYGGIVGTALCVAISFSRIPMSLHYYAVANFLAVLATIFLFSVISSLLGKRNSCDQLDWTYLGWRKCRKDLPKG